MLRSNQRGRGQEPVIVVGNTWLAVVVNMLVYIIRLRGLCKWQPGIQLLIYGRGRLVPISQVDKYLWTSRPPPHLIALSRELDAALGKCVPPQF